MKNTIILKNYSNIFEEFVAGGTITPGHLTILGSNGKITSHSESQGNVLPIIPIEDALQGKGIEDTYASGDVVRCWIPMRGDIVNCLLANGEHAVIGDWLVSNGDGTLKVLDVESTGDYRTLQIVGQATEEVDMSGSNAVDPSGRIAVRIV